MNIASVQAVALDFGERRATSKPRASWTEDARVGSPMAPYPRYAEVRSSWTPNWPGVGVVVTAEDGTQGLGIGTIGRPMAALVDDYLGPRIVGEPALATERLYDMMLRLCSPFGATGIASYAVSAIDLALWDLKGKVLDRPVYELMGGPSRDEIVCYATGPQHEWHLELGFTATKHPCRYGPSDGLDGLRRNVDDIAALRDLVGPDVELMLDCWMSLDVEYAVRLIEELRPFKLKWIEEALRSEDMDSHAALRDRVPWQALATGEHWYTPAPFQHAASRRLVDILQPDIMWVGGITALMRICAIADAAGLSVIPHAGVNEPYGQHACFALPGIPWGEYFVASGPGTDLADAVSVPGAAHPVNGRLRPSDAPGFGIEIDLATLQPYS